MDGTVQTAQVREPLDRDHKHGVMKCVVLIVSAIKPSRLSLP